MKWILLSQRWGLRPLLENKRYLKTMITIKMFASTWSSAKTPTKFFIISVQHYNMETVRWLSYKTIKTQHLHQQHRWLCLSFPVVVIFCQSMFSCCFIFVTDFLWFINLRRTNYKWNEILFYCPRMFHKNIMNWW